MCVSVCVSVVYVCMYVITIALGVLEFVASVTRVTVPHAPTHAHDLFSMCRVGLTMLTFARVFLTCMRDPMTSTRFAHTGTELCSQVPCLNLSPWWTGMGRSMLLHRVYSTSPCVFTAGNHLLSAPPLPVAGLPSSRADIPKYTLPVTRPVSSFDEPVYSGFVMRDQKESRPEVCRLACQPSRNCVPAWVWIEGPPSF